jgi:guanylate kinase
MRKGILIIISGPSGVGKGTIRKRVMDDPSLNLWYSVSMTTRQMRPGEVEGRDYYFVTDQEFDFNIARNNLLEWTEFVGHKYGTPLDKLTEKLEAGKNVILEIEVNGTEQVLQKCAALKPVSIFIMPPNFPALESRIRGRSTEGEDAIEARLSKAKKEMLLRDNYEYVVDNDDATRAVIEIQEIIRNEIAKGSSKN